MTRTPLAAGLLGLATVSLAAGRPQQAEPFRAGTDLVSVHATVVDKNTGGLVTGLELLDFEVRDEGQIRPIVVFSSTPRPFHVVILLDRSGSMADHFDLVRDAAAEFVRQMWPDDRARIGSFSDRITFSPEAFSGSRAILTGILEHGLPDMGPSPVWTAIDRSMTVLQAVPDRRVVLVFSDGHDDVSPGQVHTSLRDVIRRTRVNGIMVYAIGFSSEVTQASFGVVPPRRGRPGGLPIPLPPRSGIRFGTKRQAPDPGLLELAEESGGGYFEWEPGQDLRATFTRVATELHQQYWIGFHPARFDGRQHDIDVRVRRRGMEVRARRSYLAPERSRH